MPRSKSWTDETGSAALEFVTLGMVLLVPMVYLVLTMAAIQGGALAVEGAARQAARVYVESGTPSDAQAAALRALEVALADHGVESPDADLSISCTPRPDACLTRRGSSRSQSTSPCRYLSCQPHSPATSRSPCR